MASDDESIYHKNFRALLLSFRDSKEYCDLTIICEDRRWEVHRLLVCSMSDWFKAACGKGFVEGDTRLIELQLEDPAIVDMMIQFFYGLDYDDAALVEPENSEEIIDSDQTGPAPDNLSDSGSENSALDDERVKPARTPLLNNALVYAMADKYQVKWLKDRAISKTWYRLTDAFKMKEYSQAIKTVWTSTPASDTGLSDVYLEAFLVRRSEILEASEAETRDLWAERGFLQDVIRAEARVLEPESTSKLALWIQARCPSDCGKEISYSWCQCRGNGVGIAFNMRHSKPQTTMFSERVSGE